MTTIASSTALEFVLPHTRAGTDMTVQIITFEDEHVHNLYPVTLGRPAYAVLCGSYRLIDWIERLDRSPRALVRDHLLDLQTADYPAMEPVSAVRCPPEREPRNHDRRGHHRP